MRKTSKIVFALFLVVSMLAFPVGAVMASSFSGDEKPLNEVEAVGSTTFEAGNYLIQNRTYKRFAQVDNNDSGNNYSTEGAVIEQFPLEYSSQQIWRIFPLGTGYYKIECFRSGRCLSVKSGDEHSKMGAIVQKTYTGAYNQQWKIIRTRNGSYKIKARSSEDYTTYDLVLDVNTQGLHSVDGLNLKQREYIDNSSYKDEWFVFKIKSDAQIGIVGIIEDKHDHKSCFNSAINSIAATDGYNSISCKLTNYLTKNKCKDVLQKSKAFISRSHGYYSATSTYILTSTNRTQWLSSVDIYDYDSNTVLTNLSNVYMVLYVGCYTAYRGTDSGARNLVVASYDAGARFVTGFEASISCDGANKWVESFFKYYEEGYSLRTSAKKATNDNKSYTGISTCKYLGS